MLVVEGVTRARFERRAEPVLSIGRLLLVGAVLLLRRRCREHLLHLVLQRVSAHRRLENFADSRCERIAFPSLLQLTLNFRLRVALLEQYSVLLVLAARRLDQMVPTCRVNETAVGDSGHSRGSSTTSASC